MVREAPKEALRKEDALDLPEPLKDPPPEGDSRVAEALPVKSRALCDTVG